MVIVETSVFTRQVLTLLSDDEYRELQVFLASRPEIGNLIPGSGGLRKVRWGASGQGKRGGVRVIYYWHGAQHRVYMVYMYPKNERDDLTPSQLRMLRQAIEED
jgi:hypothetical protein